MDRIDRPELFMGIADLYAQRSTCLRGQVGAVIIYEGRPLAAGYNGAPPALPHCTDVGCDLHTYKPVHGAGTEFHDEDEYIEVCERTIHAEANAIAWAARLGARMWGATMYCTHSPCRPCAQLLVSSGIGSFYYRKNYHAERLDILEACGVKVVKLA